MNILYLSHGKYPDYQGDILFSGLRKLLGSTVVDLPKIDILYSKTFEEDPQSIRSIGWGKGFTVYGKLPECDVDRSDLKKKIDWFQKTF